MLLLPLPALAADGEGTPLNLGAAERTVAQTAPGASGSGLVRTFVGLAIVIGVIYGLHWVLKQVKASREERATGAGLRSLATLPLGPNRALHLVQAGREVVLVGAGEKGVTPIRSYSLDEARRLGVVGADDDGAPAAPAPVRRRNLLEELRARTVIR